MVLEHADIRILPGNQAEFEAAMQHGLSTVHARAQGMQGYKLERCVEAPERYLLQIQWNRLDDHMVTYRESEPAAEFRAIVRPYLVQPAEVLHFELVLQGEGSKV